MNPGKYKSYIVIALTLVFVSCATYYQKSLKFQRYLQDGEVDKAENVLEGDKKGPEGKNRLLYYLNRGYISWMQSEYEESNQFLQQADRIIEDQIKNYGLDALALLSNPMIKPYKPEDFEAVMLNYFIALNYLKLNDYEDAIVECKRINIRLNSLNDKYKDHKNRYQRDAFANVMMGLVYDADRDYNNAFIAYRNALEVYEEDYAKNFDITAPDQLKQDLLRTAYLTGFYDEVRFYEKKFNMKYEHKAAPEAQLVFFWFNGLGPIKDEWSINFTKVDGQGGWITLVNEEYGLSFPFYIGGQPDNEKSAFEQFSMMRVAFPKYVERVPLYNSASIKANNQNYSLEMAQNINDIAFKTLHDRMLREMATSLLRLATKKALEQQVRKQNGELGAAVSIVNAITEKADTRNWQTLPYSVSYTRVPLKEGSNNLQLNSYSKNADSRSYDFSFEAKKGKTYFHAFHNIETIPWYPN